MVITFDEDTTQPSVEFGSATDNEPEEVDLTEAANEIDLTDSPKKVKRRRTVY